MARLKKQLNIIILFVLMMLISFPFFILLPCGVLIFAAFLLIFVVILKNKKFTFYTIKRLNVTLSLNIALPLIINFIIVLVFVKTLKLDKYHILFALIGLVIMELFNIIAPMIIFRKYKNLKKKILVSFCMLLTQPVVFVMSIALVSILFPRCNIDRDYQKNKYFCSISLFSYCHKGDVFGKDCQD